MNALIEFILCLIPFFKPNYIVQIPLLNKIYNVLQILIAAIIILKFIKGKKLSVNMIYILMIEILLIFISLINNLPIVDIIKNSIQAIILCMMIEIFARKDLKRLFLALTIIFNILILIDFLFVVLYPNGIRVGLYNIWFFGAKNGHITFILPAIFCNYIYTFILTERKKATILQFLFLLTISFYILYTVQSSTSIIVVLSLIFLMFFSNNKLYSKISMRFISLVYLLLVIGIIVFQVQNNFAGFFQNVLEKDVTFTGRTEIWDKTMDLIKKQPIIGYGAENSDLRIIKLNNISALNAHNMILEIMYEGGILLTLVFVCFWIRLCGKVDFYSKKQNNNILKSVLIVYCIELLTEVFYFEILLWIFILIYEIASSNKIEWDVKKCQEAQKVLEI